MHKIKNSASLSSTPLRHQAIQIAEAGLEAIDTQQAIHRTVKLNEQILKVGAEEFGLNEQGKIYLIGIGKCAGEAGLALESILGDRLTAGIVLDVAPVYGLARTKSLVGTHPMPSAENMAAVEQIIALLSQVAPQDLVIMIISGGGSTLLCSPPDGLSYLDEKNLLQALFSAGATIQEINTIRKHLSKTRGGGLAKAAYPAEVVTLIFSDIPGNKIEFVASGPTIKDNSTVEDARRMLERYKLTADHLLETPKEDKYFERVHNLLVVSNQIALEAMKSKAEEIGYSATIKTVELTGEARDVGSQLIQELHNSAPSGCLLYGGETTVTVTGSGQGGRNQELVLSASKEVTDNELVLSLASDGVDNGDFAGALADTNTRKQGMEAGLNPDSLLKNNDSHAFFAAIGDYLDTGHTGSNVADLVVTLKGGKDG